MTFVDLMGMLQLHTLQHATLPQTNMETHIAPFKGTVVCIGPFLGFHVSFREGIQGDFWALERLPWFFWSGLAALRANQTAQQDIFLLEKLRGFYLYSFAKAGISSHGALNSTLSMGRRA